MNRDALTNQLIYLFKYAISSLLGVAFDFGIYTALSYNGILPPGLANAVSIPIGGFVGWLIAGKTIFHTYGITSSGYLVWAVYLLLVIAVSSIMIQFLVGVGLDKYIAKILMIGIAFCVNSVFFKHVVLKKFSAVAVCS